MTATATRTWPAVVDGGSARGAGQRQRRGGYVQVAVAVKVHVHVHRQKQEQEQERGANARPDAGRMAERQAKNVNARHVVLLGGVLRNASLVNLVHERALVQACG